MEWLFAPFEVAFVQRALWAGLLVSVICALAGTWVVVRGTAFLGDAMAHGMLPGVAVAALLGASPLIGAAISCAVMGAGVSVLGRQRRFAADTGIGLLFVGMLALGVIIVSRSQSFAVDLTGFLFGDVLAVRTSDLGHLAVAGLIALTVTVLGHRAFVALTFDPRTARTLGLRPELARVALVGLMTLAIVSSFHIVGTLLVFGLLIAPPATATLLTHRIPLVMTLAALLGALATVLGLLVSWHAETAAGATIAGLAVVQFFVVAVISGWTRGRGARVPNEARADGPTTEENTPAVSGPRRRRPWRVASVSAVTALAVAGCGGPAAPPEDTEQPHGYIAGAEETADEQIRLVIADRAGTVRVLDPATEQSVVVGTPGSSQAVRRAVGDDRYAYLATATGLRVVDGGGWQVDHGDHMHYYRTEPRELATLAITEAVTAAHSDAALTALVLDDRDTLLLDRAALDAGEPREAARITGGVAVPYEQRLIVVRPDSGRLEVAGPDGVTESVLAPPCPRPQGQTRTRRGVVFGCADGAVLVSHDAGNFTATAIPYPRPVDERERARTFEHRPGSDVLAARAGRVGAWILDVGARSWTFAPVGALSAVTTAGAGTPVLGLTPEGALVGLDPATGAENGRVALLGSSDAATRLTVDSSRAYVNDVAASVIHEIDYNDDLRVARTLPAGTTPEFLVETGR